MYFSLTHNKRDFLKMLKLQTGLDEQDRKNIVNRRRRPVEFLRYIL
ncbi:hypothetical protein OFAG_02367 [Oxalobacter formigenes HOxBLS]|uniref:Uncharacterized protein n=1 Tax=Oxalobacter paraformigenes TaxID=556268 RepID=T5LV10_9BURK|nr:hypothetical protein OFAG_02367 [Oxalobacter paraformigenes]